jgi:hypothetical protein
LIVFNKAKWIAQFLRAAVKAVTLGKKRSGDPALSVIQGGNSGRWFANYDLQVIYQIIADF